MQATETIHPLCLTPWEEQIQLIIAQDKETIFQTVKEFDGTLVATCCAEKKGAVSIGVVAQQTDSEAAAMYVLTLLGTQSEQNPYTAAFKAIAKALE